MLDIFAECLAWHIDAGEQFKTRRAPGGGAAGENTDIRVAVSREDARSTFGQSVAVIAQHDAGRPPRHERRELQLEAAQWHRAGEQEMTLREDQLLAHIDEREFAAAVDEPP